MTYQALTKEQMLQLLQEKRLRMEADHYDQVVEAELAHELGMEDVVEICTKRQVELTKALTKLGSLIAGLS